MMRDDIHALGAKARLEVAWKIENVPQFVGLLGRGKVIGSWMYAS